MLDLKIVTFNRVTNTMVNVNDKIVMSTVLHRVCLCYQVIQRLQYMSRCQR